MNRRTAIALSVGLGLAVVLMLLVVHPGRLTAPLPTAPPGVAAPSGFVTFSTDVMATAFQITLPEGDGAAALADSVFAAFRDVDARMSEWKETSPLSAVNREAGTRPVAVPADLREVIRRGIEVGNLTGGAFDITWAALWGLWDFKAAEPRVPDPAEAARRAALVDYRRVVVDDAAGTVFLPEPGMKIGLGGIAKGYALDRAAEILRRHGVRDFLILGGGQVMAGGRKNGKPWRVGIRDPRGEPDDFFASLDVTDASTSTSGDYERFFIADGVRYHHILDPRTGMPARGLRSVTTVSPDATLADALSTAILVMGEKRGLALAESLGVGAVIVDDAGRTAITADLRGRLLERHAPRVSSP